MMPLTPALAYRRAATQRTSMVGIVIALYDTLAGDLYRAIAALQSGDIETRCAQLKHGFSVLTQLDSLLDMERGGETAERLRRFYAHLRATMLRAQFKQDPGLLVACASHLLQVRNAWQQIEARSSTAQPEPVAIRVVARPAAHHGTAGVATDHAEPIVRAVSFSA